MDGYIAIITATYQRHRYLRQVLQQVTRQNRPRARFVLVSDGRVVGEGTGSSWAQVADLLGQARADAGRRRPRRQDRDEQALRDAGIGPGHASLGHPPLGRGTLDEPADAR